MRIYEDEDNQGMTTNIDHAADIIAAPLRPLVKGYADALGGDLAAQLCDAGLLAPDLPAVTHRAGMGCAGTEYPMSSGRFARVDLASDGGEYLWAMFKPGSVTLIHNRGKRADEKGREWPDTRHMYLDPDAACEIAYTLLAAARAARQTLEENDSEN